MNLDFLIDQLPVSNFDLVQHEGLYFEEEKPTLAMTIICLKRGSWANFSFSKESIPS